MSTKRKSADEEPQVAGDSVQVAKSSKKRRRDATDDGEEESTTTSKSSKKEKKDRKEKKDKKDKKSKKLKTGQEPAALPELDDPEDDVEETAAKQDKKEKKKEKKSKKSKSDDGPTPAAETADNANDAAASTKKDKKSKKKNKDNKAQSTEKQEEDTPMADAQNEEEQPQGGNGKKNRFIVFVGNLPFSATVPQIEAHFASLHPISVRLLHKREDPTKSRGAAFVEFGGYDHMKTCLKTMHHSMFYPAGAGPDGTNTTPSFVSGANGNGNGNGGYNNKKGGGWKQRKAEEPRKINVELTAGGGGNTEYRRDKIRAKNIKLDEERARRAEAEEKAKRAKEKKKAAGGDEKEEQESKKEYGNGEIHPSRLAQMAR